MEGKQVLLFVGLIYLGGGGGRRGRGGRAVAVAGALRLIVGGKGRLPSGARKSPSLHSGRPRLKRDAAGSILLYVLDFNHRSLILYELS